MVERVHKRFTKRLPGFRNHDFKIVRKHSVVNARAFRFSNRVVSHRNLLSYRSQVHASSVAVFRRSLTSID